MEDIEYLLDRIAFLEDRLAHLESILMPKKDTSQTNLLEVYRQIQNARAKSTTKIYNSGVMPVSGDRISFEEYCKAHLRGDL